MQESENQKFENAKKLKDFLKKKSPRLFKGFQKRYFIIANEGQQLAWFKNDNMTSKPKGCIPIKEISEIKVEGNVFRLSFLDRKFEMKADTKEQLQIWVSTLEFLKNYWIKYNSIMTESAKEKGASYHKWKALDEESLKAIKCEKEKKLAEQTNLTKNLDNRTVLQEKGIYDYVQHIKPEGVLNRRMLAGFINKRSKGKMKYFLRRWFILISAKPLFENDQDEEILDESKLPPWMELDTLYYFKFKTDKDKTNKKGEIKMKDCLEIVVKDMKKSKEKGYSFKINMGDRLYHIMTEAEIERSKWAEGLRNSIKTAKEMTKKKGIKKNIDNIVATYDSAKTQEEKSKAIRQKIDNDIKKFRDRFVTDEKLESFDQLATYLDPLKIEFLDTLNACLAKEIKRTDIIKEYIDYFHENICTELRTFWEKYYDAMGSYDYLKVNLWTTTYSESMKQFFSDDRIPTGSKVLLNAYFYRMQKGSEEMIDSIVLFENKNQPQKAQNGAYFSSSPCDLFKIMNEILEISFKLYPYKEMSVKLASICKKLISYYQSKLQDLLEDEELDISKYICVCNNVISFNNSVKEFNEKLIQSCLKPHSTTPDADAEKYFDSQFLIKNFTNIGLMAKDIIFNVLFSELNSLFKVSFLNIKLDGILNIIGKNRENMETLHDSFSRKVWRSLLEKIVIFYFQTMIVSCNKAGKDDLEDFIQKLKDDQEYLTDQFNGIIFSSTLQSELKPFDDMIPFLEETSVFTLQSCCKNLRRAFGPAFNEKTIKAIFNARSDLDSHDKKDIIDGCKETLNLYNKENLDKENQDNDANRVHDLFGEGINLEEKEEGKELEVKEEEEKEEKKNRKKSLKLEDVPDGEETQKEQKINEEKKEEKFDFNGEGYLFKKPAKKLKLKWEKRYFRIKNGVLYWYLNERSRECQNKLPLNDMEVSPHKKIEKNTKFIIKISNPPKTYKFMADSQKERTIWIKAIKLEIHKLRNNTDEEIVQMQLSNTTDKKPLFIDFDEIRRKEEIIAANEKKKQDQLQKKQAKLQNLKAKMMVKKMTNNMTSIDQMTKNNNLSKMANNNKNNMNNPNFPKSSLTDTSSHNGEKGEIGCWGKFLDCLGLENRRGERLMSEEEGTFN